MKKLLSLPLGIIAAFIPASFAFADDLCPKDNGTAIYSKLCTYNASNFGQLLGKIITFVFILVTIVALFYLIWGGFKWLTSGGDSKQVDAARGHIIAAIIGLIVVFLSYFILNFVVGFFIPGFSINTITIPTL